MAQGKNRNFFKELFIFGAWINWLAPIATLFYAIVSLGCMNSKVFVTLYLAAISPSAGTVVRVGYFGVCIQTPENKPSWICSRFLKGDKGLNAQHLSLIKSVKSMQCNAFYPLPVIAACMFFALYLAYLLFRNRSERNTRYIVFGLWVSCTIGFASAMIPMMIGQAMNYAGPVYGSTVKMEMSVANIVMTWVAFFLHFVYILAAGWWQKRIGGAGDYGAGAYGMDEEGMQRSQYQGHPR